MTGFSSFADIILQTATNRKSGSASWIRTINTGATSTAGAWHDTFSGGGTGGVGTITGTSGFGNALSASSAGALPISPVSVASDLRYALKFSAQVAAATAAPGIVLLTDLLYIYTSCNVLAGGFGTLTNTAAKPARFGTGEGVEVSAIVVTAHGATTPSLTVNYTNTNGVINRVGNLSAPIASAPVGRLYAGGATAGVVGGPYMTLQPGDVGVRELTSYQIPTGGGTGAVTFVLHRPILEIPIIAANAPTFESYIGSDMPKIDDDACLAMFVLVGGALPTGQTVTATLRHGWN